MLGALAFLKSKFMGYLAVAAVGVGVIFGTYRAGRNAEAALQAKRTLKGLADKQEVDHEVDRLSNTARRNALREWMPNDE